MFCNRRNYEMLMRSGLYKTLAEKGLLVAHEETGEGVIRPERVPYISYPYEWSFSQLKDAALLTLEIQRTALAHGMSLKDASAYNVQFLRGKPIFIDTLSFGARFSLGLMFHVFLHARMQRKYSETSADKSPAREKRQLGDKALLGIIDSLFSTVEGLKWKGAATEWGDYYQDTNYTSEAFDEKKRIVRDYARKISPRTVFDLGANDGTFSRIVEGAELVVSFDIDPLAVERNYLRVKSAPCAVLPLLLDLTNPSPSLGWGSAERKSVFARERADLVLALALVHHLAISNNVPLGMVAECFSRLGDSLIVEFVPKSDSQVERLLRSREDIFDDYTEQGFVQAFEEFFTVREVHRLSGSERVIYLMDKRQFKEEM